MLHKAKVWSRAARGAALLACVLLAGGGAADDREFLTTGEPYLLVILDSSESMSGTTPCTREQALSDMNPFDAMCTSECPLEDAECQHICPDYGCREYDFTIVSTPGTEPTIIRDNGGAGSSDVGWTGAVVDATAEGGTYLYHVENPTFPPVFPFPTCGDIFIVFGFEFAACSIAEYDPSADLTTAGDYMVFLKWPVDAGGVFASNTLVEIEHSESGVAVTSTVAVNQQLEGGQWNAIGTYEIDPAVTGGTVTIRNENANGIAVADAVGWLEVEIPPCLGSDVYRCQQPICTEGDCFTPLNSDDPRAKFFQAKQSLYEVIDEVPDIHYGFATFEQDHLRLSSKHWLYRVAEQAGLPTLDGTDFLTGAAEVFGNGDLDGWNCFTLGPLVDGRVGCDIWAGRYPADLTSPWDLERARRIPRLGFDGTGTTTVWYRVAQFQLFKVVYSPVTVSLGASQIKVNVDVTKCENPFSCLSPVLESGTVVYDLVSDYVALDGPTQREPMRLGGYFHGQTNTSGIQDPSSCEGIEGNEDSSCDVAAGEICDPFPPASNPTPGYNLRWPTDSSDARSDPHDPPVSGISPNRLFDVGDFVPLDWQDQHTEILAGRMAPNILGGATVPDFRTAVYFSDTLAVGDSPLLTERLLRLKHEKIRPILPLGRTPLGESLLEVQNWYEKADDVGWADVASTDDPEWACRTKAVLMLTDGRDECALRGFQNPCPIAAELYDPDDALGFTPEEEELRRVETYVVGFGLPAGDASDLRCMAQNGRTLAEVDITGDDPYLFLPENRDELAEDLKEIFLGLLLESQTFAAAALPAVQSAAADNIYFSSFTPLEESFTPLEKPSFWPGRLDAFRRPLPLTADGEPDFDLDCVSNSLQAACHSWEAGEKLCGQAPDAADAGNGIFKLGDDPATERRIIYGKEKDVARPNALRLFDTPEVPADPGGGNPNPALGSDAEDLVAALDPAELRRYEADRITPSELEDFFVYVIGETVRIKPNGFDPADPLFPDTIGGCDTTNDGNNDSYVLGDIFHATPAALLNPNNFRYFADNHNGYRDFARENTWRRRMLAVAANDGQLHFIDVGLRRLVDNDFTSDPNDKIELLGDGSGHELFSYIPRLALPILRQQVDSNRHIFSVDGTVTVADVYIDPEDATGGADPAEREWRTVLLGGMREGGDIFRAKEGVRNFKSGYYALDVTQPDIMNPRTDSGSALIPCPASAPNCDETTLGLPDEWVPSCLDFNYSGDGSQDATPPTGCDFPFPSELWVFTDSVRVLESQVPLADDGVAPDELLTFYLDEDGNGIPDLADTWSQPVIGQIRVCETGGTLCDLAGDHSEVETVQVAVFGGGMDPARKGDAEVGGNFLYMIDVETGELVYKRELPCPPDEAGCEVGSAAGDPAVIDKNRDGFFDIVYIGTTEGKLYKVDLTALDGSGLVPERATFTVDTEQLLLLNSLGEATRFVDEYPPAPPPTVDISQPARVVDAAWEPFLILDTGGTPIYHAPVSFYIPERNQYGLAIGTGDREDIRDRYNGEDSYPPSGGRFFVIVDDDLAYDPDLYDIGTTPNCEDRLPITEDCVKSFAYNSDPTALELATDYLLAPESDTDWLALETYPRPGWVLTLESSARVNVEAFLISGILVFSAYDPELVAFIGDDDCQKTGTTFAFVVSIKNAGPIAPLGDFSGGSPPSNWGERAVDRYHEIEGGTTNPYVENTMTQNPGAQQSSSDPDYIAEAVRQAVIDQYPRGSRLNYAFGQQIKASETTTGSRTFVTVPIAVYPADWKDQ